MKLLTIAVALAGIALSAVARAGDGIVLEAQDSERSADADALLRPVYAELGRRGFVVGDRLVAAIEGRMSRASKEITASDVVEAQRDVDRAYEHFIDGDYDQAAAGAQKALDRYAAASAQLTREPALRDLQFKALLIAARSHEVLNHGEDSFRFAAEAIRTFPDRTVSTAEFDPRVSALHRRVKAELTKQGTGSLDIQIDDPGAVVFVDEHFAGSGATVARGLFPGTYRVHVGKGDKAGRVHDVRIDPGATVTLALSASVELGLRTSPGHVGLALPGQATDDDIAAAIQVARALGAPTVVLLGVRKVAGRRSVVGYAIATESQTRVFGAIQVEPVAPSPAALAQLAAFLTGDKRADTSHIVTRDADPEPPVTVAARPPRPAPPWSTRRWVGFSVGVAGVAALGGGAFFGVLTGLKWQDAKDACGGTLACSDATKLDRANHLKDQARLRGNAATALFAVGGAAVIAGGVLWFTAPPGHAEHADTALRILPTLDADGVGLAAMGAF